MGTTLLATIISGLLTLAGVIITVTANNRSITAKLEQHQAVTDEKLTNLTKQVEKHNQIVERTFRLEERTEFLEKQVERIGGKS